jgi:hypothetical protein
MIPVHVDGNHWVAVVRRAHEGKVSFYYSDDLNSDATYNSVRDTLSHRNTAILFHQTDAIWVNCPSTTYQPHSNECGPRTILALIVMALLLHPHKNMLSPLMRHNSAQIAQWWTAHIVANASFDRTPLEPLLNTSQSCSPPRTAASHPSDLATLSHILSLTDIVTSTQVHPIPPITNQDASSPPISMAGNIIGAPPPIINEGPMNIITKDDSSLSSDTTSWLSRRKFNKDCSSYAFHPN